MAFGWDDAFLLAMSAAGAIININEAGKQKELIKMGRQLEQAAINTNLEALRAEAAESSANAMQDLSSNVATQVVTNAARGVSSGFGSGAAAIADAESNFAKDEKTRRLNLLVKENELRAANVLSGLHTLQSETQLGQSLTNQIFKNLPISSLVDKFKNSSKTPTLKSEIPSISSAFSKKSGFGLNPV